MLVSEFLLMAAVSIAVIHSLAPDHYLPVSAIGRSRRWSLRKTMMFSFAAASIHVSSSAIMGFAASVGVNMIGFAEAVEAHSPIVLVSFGLVYAIVSHFRPHRHVHAASLTTLLLILGLSPCVPLVPLMLSADGFYEMLAVASAFSAATIFTVLLLTYLSYRAYRPPRIAEREDVVSGLIIALTGVAVWILEMAAGLVDRRARNTGSLSPVS